MAGEVKLAADGGGLICDRITASNRLNAINGLDDRSGRPDDPHFVDMVVRKFSLRVLRFLHP